MRRLIAAAVALIATLGFGVGVAGAGDLGWHLTASGTVHCNLDTASGYHLNCDKYAAGGGFQATQAPEDWLPRWCADVSIVDGDNAGTPATIRFASLDRLYPSGTDGEYGCSSNGQSTSAAWCAVNNWYGNYTACDTAHRAIQGYAIWPTTYVNMAWRAPVQDWAFPNCSSYPDGHAYGSCYAAHAYVY